MREPVLNRRLVLERAWRTADGAGGHGLAWQAAGILWAEVSSTTGRGVAAPAGALSRVTHRIRVRAAPAGAPSRPVAGQRLREGARIFRIIAVAEADTRGRFLTCLAEEEGVQ